MENHFIYFKFVFIVINLIFDLIVFNLIIEWNVDICKVSIF